MAVDDNVSAVNEYRICMTEGLNRLDGTNIANWLEGIVTHAWCVLSFWRACWLVELRLDLADYSHNSGLGPTAEGRNVDPWLTAKSRNARERPPIAPCRSD